MAIAQGQLGPRVRWAFSDRLAVDGVVSSGAPYDAFNVADHVGDDPDAVQAHRDALAESVGVQGHRLVSMAPVHGNDVGEVGAPQPDPVPEVDALVTRVPGIALLTVAADCVPVLLGDSDAGVVAVVHAGWRGIRSDVVGTTLASMVELGAEASRIRAVVGPAVCGLCYDVPRDRYDEVVAVAPSAASVARDGAPGLDLRAAAVDRLRRAGAHVSLHGGCTQESDDLYSFRRDRLTGRHGGVVALVPEQR
ncbi:MAG: peptidoglycan editing factor PgeF [Candidatus Nanopelagicales bacterium]